MSTSNRKHIALISVHGDPAIEIGKEEAGGQNVYVRQVGEALAKLGWQVDMFTRKANAEQAKIVEHAPNCRNRFVLNIAQGVVSMHLFATLDFLKLHSYPCRYPIISMY